MTNPLAFDHLPYIATAYGFFGAVVLWAGLGTRARLARATRRLRAADPRAGRVAP